MRAYVLILLAALALTPATAGAEALRRLDTGTDSKGWEAVGRLNLDGKGFCTGALIAEDLVLTAAHCLFDRRSGARIDPSRIEFLAGWRNGRASAYRKVRKAATHPGYVFQVGAGDVRHDLALLRLDQPIRVPSIRPYATGSEPAFGARVGVVSYAHDRADAASLQNVCHILRYQAGVMVLSCDVDFGSSGAPVFSMEGGVPRVVSVVAAKAEMTGQKVALGTTLAPDLAALRAALDAPPSIGNNLPQIGSGGILRGAAAAASDKLPQIGADTARGAKFVKGRERP
ncbi:MAG: trypsin-like peptidase domain-containing protein [Gemmobacter sp.]|nr:trypsin-like peptidase domain-containing protein [Gemmobacter sp.]